MIRSSKGGDVRPLAGQTDAVGRPRCLSVAELATLDRQHDQLLALIEMLRRAFEADLPRIELLPILSEIYYGAKEHFGTEEAVMFRLRVARAAEHRSDHEGLLDVLTSLLVAFETGNYDLDEATFRYLGDWLNRHLESWDRDLPKPV